MNKFIIILFIFFIILLVGYTFIPKGSHISVAPNTFDFGDIVQSKGIVSTVFKVKNTGNKPLIINRLSTSCGCTTAKMDESPLNGGETREMTVTFDPMVHPDQFGKIERAVYLQTSDKKQPEIELSLYGNVIK